MPPDQLEVEFKKAMAEKKRKEEEEKCIQEIKNRQKKTGQESQKRKRESHEKRSQKENKKKAEEETEGGAVENDGFYGGINMEADIKRMEEKEVILKRERLEMHFKSSFAEVPRPRTW